MFQIIETLIIIFFFRNKYINDLLILAQKTEKNTRTHTKQKRKEESLKEDSYWK